MTVATRHLPFLFASLACKLRKRTEGANPSAIEIGLIEEGINESGNEKDEGNKETYCDARCP